MRFGRVDSCKLEELDLRLPEDHPETKKLLNKLNTHSPSICVGCAKWGRKE